MKILGLDSSGLVASVAVQEDGELIAEYTTNYKKTHSQTLLPMLDEVKKMIDLDLSALDAIAVAAGPGSFTGLRIGSATAKGLGLALDLPIVPVPTVEALAYQLWGADGYICPVMDARRNQTYTGIYMFEHGEFHTILPQCAIGIEDLLEQINENGHSVIFLGDGVPVFQEQIKTMIRVPFLFAPAHRSRQSAAAVAALGMEYYKKGQFITADLHVPEYLRLSQAERERLEKEKQNENPSGKTV